MTPRADDKDRAGIREKLAEILYKAHPIEDWNGDLVPWSTHLTVPLHQADAILAAIPGLLCTEEAVERAAEAIRNRDRETWGFGMTEVSATDFARAALRAAVGGT